MLTRRSARINKNADDCVVVNDYFNEYKQEENKLEQEEDDIEEEETEHNPEQAQAQQEEDDIEEEETDHKLEQAQAPQAQAEQEEDDIEEELSEDPINNSHENITIEQCLDGYYDNITLNEENVVMDIESALNYNSYQACKIIFKSLHKGIIWFINIGISLVKYPILLTCVVVLSSIITGYFTYGFINHSVGFVTKCEYFPEEKRCLYDTSISIINPMEYHRSFVRKNTYIRITHNSLEYWNPWMHKKIIKYDNHDCVEQSCSIINVINNKQIIIAINNSIDTINSKVIDKYSDINQITVINDNKWIPIKDIDPVILKTLTEKMFEMREGKIVIDNTTFVTNTIYTNIYTLFTMLSIGIYIFQMM